MTIGYGLLAVERLRFLLQAVHFGDVAVLLAYEGPVVGLFVLLAITDLAIMTGDAALIFRGLGLTALAH